MLELITPKLLPLFLFATGLINASAQSVCAAQMTAIALPQIPAKQVSVTQFGAVGDGKTDCVHAIQGAIAACVKAGGGTITVPAGGFLTSPFALASNINLHLDKGATLLFTTDPKDYLSSDGKVRQCIEAVNCHDIAVTGAGTIDGQGSAWWPRYRKTYVLPAGAPPLQHRPFMVTFTRCTRVLVQDVHLLNSPMFHLVPSQCQDVTIKNIQITAPDTAPNTDGLDPSGWNYLITGCTFDVGDDCIALKPAKRINEKLPSCRNFIIQDCTFLHGHGLSIGGQTPGGLDGLLVRNCTFHGTGAGIRMKAARGAGGLVQNLTYENLTMDSVKVPIYLTSYYPKAPADPVSDPAQPMTETTPVWQHIQISHLTVTNSPSAGQILGLPEAPIVDITLTDVHISAAKALQIVHANGVRFINSQITVTKGPAITAQASDVTGLDMTTGR